MAARAESLLGRRVLFWGFGLALAASCGDASPENQRLSGDSNSSGGTAGAGGGATGGSGAVPPEMENDESYTAPAVSGRWIWTANPESGRVALIDAVTTRVTTANAGLSPTHLAALAGETEAESGAIVINVGSRDLSVFRANEGAIGLAAHLPLGAAANRLSVSPSSRWAVAWSDASLVPNVDPTEGMQDVTVVDLFEDPPATRRLSVGYRPNRVFISSDESELYVVSEPSVSVIELGGEATARVLRDVAVTSDPTEAPSVRDVTVTPDGSLFFVRRENSPIIDVVSLVDERKATVTLPGVVTDLDLAPDAESAYAVVRGRPAVAELGVGESGAGGQPGGDGLGGVGGDDGTGGATDSLVAVLPVPAILDAPSVFETFGVAGVFGSIAVAPDGERALLFTNATASDRVVVLETDTGRYRTVVVQAPVRAVVLATDGEHAVVLLGQAQGSTKPGGFSLVPLASTLPPRIVGTDAPVAAVAVDATRALVTMTGPNLPNGVYFARMPELSVELIRLASEPLAAALLPDVGVGFVAQSHPEGRITFVDLASGEPRTITGFELGSKVVTGD